MAGRSHAAIWALAGVPEAPRLVALEAPLVASPGAPLAGALAAPEAGLTSTMTSEAAGPGDEDRTVDEGTLMAGATAQAGPVDTAPAEEEEATAQAGPKATAQAEEEETTAQADVNATALTGTEATALKGISFTAKAVAGAAEAGDVPQAQETMGRLLQVLHRDSALREGCEGLLDEGLVQKPPHDGNQTCRRRWLSHSCLRQSAPSATKRAAQAALGLHWILQQLSRLVAQRRIRAGGKAPHRIMTGTGGKAPHRSMIGAKRRHALLLLPQRLRCRRQQPLLLGALLVQWTRRRLCLALQRHLQTLIDWIQGCWLAVV